MKFFEKLLGKKKSSARAEYASRDAGAHRGIMGGYNAQRVRNEDSAAREREVIQRRAEDLAANDWIANALLSAYEHNVIGTGLVPTAQIPYEMLGISQEEALKIGKSFEWIWYRWGRKAGFGGNQSIEEMQRLALRTMLVDGEVFHLPVMRSEEERKAEGAVLSLAVQSLSPMRLKTPSALSADTDVKDGIRFGANGVPEKYYIAVGQEQSKELAGGAFSPDEWEEIPAKVGHRPGVLHIFEAKNEEQIRGESVFANSMHLYRLLDDSIANELSTQVLSSKYAIWVSRDPTLQGAIPPGAYMGGGYGSPSETAYYTDLDGVSILYGNEGEKPQVLENTRPSENVQQFWGLVQNAIAASAGLPYIAVSKDYSQVNYSSARAALNEAWRVYKRVRAVISEKYCQPIWEMVVEEAILRGIVKLPEGADFYRDRALWCSAAWNGPARGYVDPVKEINAEILAVDNLLKTRREVMAQEGRDYDDEMPIIKRETEEVKRLRGTGEAGEKGGKYDV